MTQSIIKMPSVTLANSAPISITNAGTLYTSNVTIPLVHHRPGDVWMLNSTNIKKYEILESTEDLLTLSCTYHRLKKENTSNVKSISLFHSPVLSDHLFQKITVEDRELSKKIHDFYSQKLMVMTLKEHPFTSYRMDLQKYLNGDGKKFVERDIGMIFRLPEFYEYDMQFLAIKDQFVNTDSLPKEFNPIERTLTPVQKLSRRTKSHKHEVFWFKDDNDFAYSFSIDSSNPLLIFMEREFKNKNIPCKLVVERTRRDEFNFYKIRSILQILTINP